MKNIEEVKQKVLQDIATINKSQHKELLWSLILNDKMDERDIDQYFKLPNDDNAKFLMNEFRALYVRNNEQIEKNIISTYLQDRNGVLPDNDLVEQAYSEMPGFIKDNMAIDL